MMSTNSHRERSADLRAGILVGGLSSRLGQPKERLAIRGRPVLTKIMDALEPFTKQVFLLGGQPAELEVRPRIPDAPGLRGPLAGILSAMRSAPDCSWLIVACDMPLVTTEAVTWLLSHRNESCSAILPMVAPGRIEPLFALYEPAALVMLETLAQQPRYAMQQLAGRPGILSPTVPDALRACWTNVNTPEDLASIDP